MNYNSKAVLKHYTEYRLNDKLHRIDGPAIEYNDGDKEYYLDHKLHRLDGPAVDYSDRKEWWIHGEHYSEQEFNEYIQSKKIPDYFNKL